MMRDKMFQERKPRLESNGVGCSSDGKEAVMDEKFSWQWRPEKLEE